MSEHRLELADIFHAQEEKFLSRWRGKVSAPQRKALRDIGVCRTAALGGHVEQCDHCSQRTIAYNSCRNRHCPKCQSTSRDRWLAERAQELLPVAYCHVVFTVPQELAPLALQNQRLFYSLLLVFLCASSILANTNREWQDAKVTKISACFTYGSPATEAVGTTFVTEPPENYRMYYSIETVGMTYILYSSFSLPLEHIWQGQNRRAPRLTLNGMTKISIDGHDAHILDDDGKDVTVSVFEKITKSK